MATKRNAAFKFTYGISLSQYDAMFARQEGLCAICGRPERVSWKNGSKKRLCVDHCHSTGKVRGLLCLLCNHALGAFNDDPELVMKAWKYLTD